MRAIIQFIFCRVPAAISKLCTQRGELSFRHIRRENLVYMLPLTVICMLLDQRNTYFALQEPFWGNDASTLAYASYAAGTLFVLATWSRRNIHRLRAMTLVAIFGFLLWVILPTSDLRTASMFMFQFIIGGAAIYATHAHVFVLNNVERLLSVLLITFNYGAFVFLRETGVNNLILSLLIPGLLTAVLAVSVFRMRAGMFPNTSDEVSIDPPKSSYLLLAISFSFFTINVFGEELVKLCTTGNDALRGVGLAVAVGLTIILLFVFRRSVWYMLGLSLLFALTGLTLLATPVSPAAHSAGNLLFGIGDGFGFMTTFYMIGIIKRYHNNTFFWRMTAATVGELFMAVLATNIISLFFPQAIPLVAVGLALLFLGVFTLLSPAFQRNIFDSEWIDDFKKLDIASITKKLEYADWFESLKLSPRERAVVKLLLRGLTIRQISAELGIGESTANKYCGTLYKKLGINSRTELFVLFGTRNNNIGEPIAKSAPE